MGQGGKVWSFRPWSSALFKSRREVLQAAIAVNELATPGLGSWMAGHRRSGTLQLLLAGSGFCLVMIHLGLVIASSWLAMERGTEYQPPSDLWWKWGFLLFGASWIWATLTSIGLYRELRRLPVNSAPPTLG